MALWDEWKVGLRVITHDLVEVFLQALPPAQVLDAFLTLPEADIETLHVFTVLERATAGAETRRCLASLLARLALPGADPLGTLQVGLRFAPRADIRPVDYLTEFAERLGAAEV